jgi:tRNA G18 (ribose-2'-O)-methylase SpoU
VPPFSVSFVTDPGDPRLDDYRALKEQRLNQESGKFIAESEPVVRRLLTSRLAIDSLLVTAPRLDALDRALSAKRDQAGEAASELPVLVVPQLLMDEIAGFHVHRGCLAVGRRPGEAFLPAQARTVVVLEDLVDVDNLGAMARNAAAFGADALFLSPRCADPFYRKAIRVSVGSVFHLPIVRTRQWPDDLVKLRTEHGFALVGAVLDDRAVPLAGFRRPERVALVLGSEGPGLTEEARRACDFLVTIPMATARADSLNVATAGAVLLYHLTQAGSA